MYAHAFVVVFSGWGLGRGVDLGRLAHVSQVLPQHRRARGGGADFAARGQLHPRGRILVGHHLGTLDPGKMRDACGFVESVFTYFVMYWRVGYSI